jgi:peptide-methionine (S)-S-oxide reductase
MRYKYRSAIYTFADEQIKTAEDTLAVLQNDFENPIITEGIPFQHFRLNNDEYLNTLR